MTIQTNITANRKALANRISQELLGAPVTYAGVPSCAYRVGACITIDREGSIEITDEDAVRILMPFFVDQGWCPAEVDENLIEPPANSEASEVPEETASDTTADPELITGTDTCTISIPADLTVSQLTNLVHMLYSQQHLLNKSVMDGRLTIPESLITRLKEYTPENPEAFTDLLHDFKALGELAGLGFENGVVSLDFPHDDEHPAYDLIYARLLERIIQAAKEASRAKAVINTSENEKYYMRAWLIRLGYGGADLKAERRLLLRNLKGHSAFPTDAAAEKHKGKYTELRRASRELDMSPVPSTDAEQEGGVQDE